jgi:hypothetical protein
MGVARRVANHLLCTLCCRHCVSNEHINLRMWYCSLEACFVILFTLIGIVLAGGTQIYIILDSCMVLRICVFSCVVSQVCLPTDFSRQTDLTYPDTTPHYVILYLCVKSNPDVAPLVVHRNLWPYIKGSGKSEYCVTGNFCLQKFMGARWG